MFGSSKFLEFVFRHVFGFCDVFPFLDRFLELFVCSIMDSWASDFYSSVRVSEFCNGPFPEHPIMAHGLDRTTEGCLGTGCCKTEKPWNTN